MATPAVPNIGGTHHGRPRCDSTPPMTCIRSHADSPMADPANTSRLARRMPDGLEHSLEKMRNEGVHEAAVDTFAHYYEMLARGERGVLAEADIEPVDELPDAADLPEAGAPLDACVVIKLNGGLGT